MQNIKPNFFILGAPKCGTTSLANWLAQHSHAFVTPTKEPHHFNTDMSHRLYPETERYNNLFADATVDHLAIGEASVWYLYSRDAVPNIEEKLPGSKYIVCLRNPTDMYHSLHMQQIFSGNEVEEDPEKAWNLAVERKQGRFVPPTAIDPMTLIYNEACALGTQLQRLFQHVTSDRVHVILLDDMAKSSEKTFDAVQDFLNLPKDPNVSLVKVNEAKSHRFTTVNFIVQNIGRLKRWLGINGSYGLLSGIESINTKIEEKTPLSPQFRQKLVEHFKPEVEMLESLIGRDLQRWKN